MVSEPIRGNGGSSFRKLLRAPRTPFQFSLLLNSVLAAKLVHLYNHTTSLPPLLFLLYLPTFLAVDVFNALLFWGLVHLTAHGRLAILLALGRSLIILILLWASAVQISFYQETGGEIKWSALSKFATDPAALKVASSGGSRASVIVIIVVAFSYVVAQRLYNRTYKILCLFMVAFTGRRLKLEIPNEAGECWVEMESSADSEFSGEEAEPFLSSPEPPQQRRSLIRKFLCKQTRSRWLVRISFLTAFITTMVLLVVRPPHFPYAHMSNSLPYTLVEIWSSIDGELCQAGDPRQFHEFPFPELISEKFWEQPKKKFVGWMPTVNFTEDEQSRDHDRPLWLPDEPVPGFDRWYQESGPGKRPPPPDFDFEHDFESDEERPPPPSQHPHRHRRHHKASYNPVTDPLRITNLDEEVLAPIRAALKERKIKIKHVVLLALESTRKDVFPIKARGNMEGLVLASHNHLPGATEAAEALSRLTPNAELLTGEDGGWQESWNFTREDPSASRPGSWRNLEKGRGGVNIGGAFTPSTVSLKSMLGSHCGVQSLPVDFTVEAGLRIYQPCIPWILNFWNRNKAAARKGTAREEKRKAKADDMTSMPWRSVYVQAITDEFDHQNLLNEHVGFAEIIVKNTLLDPDSKHYPPTEKQSNYFGFPEPQVKPYLEDLFREAKENNERLFLSHLTSTTHHPWNLPEGNGESVEYLRRKQKWWFEHPLNRYLNTIKYIDGWLGEVMDIIENTGAADETLVVMVGDHGMAFQEDSPLYTTFENGHISNMRVPLLFHHPQLPRIQLSVNATSLSILPTILDLLATTSSLNAQDTNIATDLIQQYEGQSLIRPYHVKKNGRQAWNIGVLNAGGAVLSVSSAAFPFRLVFPICKAGEYRFTSTDIDPSERFPVSAYSVSALSALIPSVFAARNDHMQGYAGPHEGELKWAKGEREKRGEEAARWVVEAEKVGKWWVLEQRRRWDFWGASLQDDRRADELEGAGTVKKKHWWDTK